VGIEAIERRVIKIDAKIKRKIGVNFSAIIYKI